MIFDDFKAYLTAGKRIMHGQAFGSSLRIVCCVILRQRNKRQRPIEKALPIQIHYLHSVIDLVEESYTLLHQEVLIVNT